MWLNGERKERGEKKESGGREDQIWKKRNGIPENRKGTWRVSAANQGRSNKARFGEKVCA